MALSSLPGRGELKGKVVRGKGNKVTRSCCKCSRCCTIFSVEKVHDISTTQRQ